MDARRGYLRTGSAAALATAAALAAASAQAADPATPDKSAQANAVSGVVITAERRVQNLQTAAISATVIDAETLEAKGVTGLTAVQFAAPGIQISDFASANTFNIRGIGQSAVPIDLPSGVVIYRDGVPTLTGYFQNAPYYDMAGVEVLRGPQGTFVGKSASAGAVFIRTRDPELGRFGGSIMLGGGNYGFAEDTLVVNMPVGDHWAIRLATHGELRDSLFDSIKNNGGPGQGPGGAPLSGDDDRRLISARIGVLYKPNDSFRAVLKVDYDHLHFGCHCTSGFDPLTNKPEDLNNLVLNGHNFYTDKGVRLSLNMSYQFANGIKLNSLSGFSTVKTRADWDANGRDPTPQDFQSHGNFTNYSQEFNLISPDTGHVRWVAGFFYQYYQNHIPFWPQIGLTFFYAPPIDDVPLLAGAWDRNETSYAGFGQVGVDLAPGLELQLGGRVGHYGFTQFTRFELYPGLLAIPFGDPPGGHHQNYGETSFDWKVNLNYKITPEHFVYALISRGHTPGSINAGPNFVTLDHTKYKPMDVINYELGWKGTFFDGHLRTQLDGYYETFKNYQAAFALATNLTGPIDAVSEFKNARTTSYIYGMEFGAQAGFGDLHVDAGLALFRSKLGSFGAVVNPFFPIYGPATVVLNGSKTPFAPEVTGNIGVEYVFHTDELGSGSTITPRMDVAYRSVTYGQLFENPATRLPSVTLLNAEIRYNRGPWWATLWGTNLTDERYATANQNVAAGSDALFPNVHIVGIIYRAPPRLFGIRIGYEW